MMIAAYVLIFVQISGIISPVVTMQPIYFQTKAACDAAALEMNNGEKQPKRGDKGRSFGAVCLPTGDTP